MAGDGGGGWGQMHHSRIVITVKARAHRSSLRLKVEKDLQGLKERLRKRKKEKRGWGRDVV